jgi:hypothetical protein
MQRQYWPVKSPGRRFFRQPVFYGGVVLGVVLAVLGGILAVVLMNFTGNGSGPITAAPQTGNVTIAIDQHALDLATQLAIKQVEPQLPITVTGVSTTLHEGDEIDITIDGQPILGITPAVMVKLSPVVASDGTLDFQVQQVQVSNLNLSLGSAVNQSLERAMNQQFAGYGRGSLGNGLHYQLVNVRTTSSALILTAQVTTS